MSTLVKILPFSAILALSACTPSLAQMQKTLDTYHVVASTNGDGIVVMNSRFVALHGGTGAQLLITAPIGLDGQRGNILERTLDEGGLLAWEIVLNERGGEKWLRLERVPCTTVRQELPELPDCGRELKINYSSDFIEQRIY